MAPNNEITPYEEARNQRIEENKKRMEELQLPALSLSLSLRFLQPSNSNSPYKSRTLERDRITVPVRRSSRIAGLPPPKISGVGRKGCASDVVRSAAIDAAAKIERDLGSGHPSFLKSMVPSHVSGRYCLNLPTRFCSIHMSKRDERFILEDENGEEYASFFLYRQRGLTDGWRGFSIDHALADGDCLIFEMVEPKRFRAFIVRAAAFESGNTLEELLCKSENLHTESVDKEPSVAKVVSNRTKQKRCSTPEIETEKPMAKCSKNGYKDERNAVNGVLKSETMVEVKIESGQEIRKMGGPETMVEVKIEAEQEIRRIGGANSEVKVN